MRNEIWRDGILIEVIETEDPEVEEIPPTDVTVPTAAIDSLIVTLDDPAVNSIAEIKTALKDFLHEMKAG